MGISSVCANHKWCTNERMVAGLGLIVLITGIALFIIQGIHVVPKSTSLLPAAKALTGVGTSLVAISFLFYTCMSCCDRLEKIIKEKNAENPNSGSSQSRDPAPNIAEKCSREHVQQVQELQDSSTPASLDSSLHTVSTPNHQPPSSSELHSPTLSSESSPVLNLPIFEPDHAQSAAEFFNGQDLFWVSQDKNFCHELDKLKKSSESKIVEIKLWENSPLAMQNVPQAICTFLGGGLLDLDTCIQQDLQDATGAAILKKLEESLVKNLVITLKADFSLKNARKIIDSINDKIKFRKINCILINACNAPSLSSMSQEIITIALEPLPLTKELAKKILVDTLKDCKVFYACDGINKEEKEALIKSLAKLWGISYKEAEQKFPLRLDSTSKKLYFYSVKGEGEDKSEIEREIDQEVDRYFDEDAQNTELFSSNLRQILSKDKEIDLNTLFVELFSSANSS